MIRLFGIIFIFISIWQFFAVTKYHHFLTSRGTDNAFSPAALYFGIIFGIIIGIIGIWITIDPSVVYSFIQ